MNKFTPAPWVLGGEEGDGEGGSGHIYCDYSSGSAVAICFGDALPFSIFSREEEIANAKLISAAPDLLDALKSVLYQFVPLKAALEIENLAIKKAHAAIQKATGESA